MPLGGVVEPGVVLLGEGFADRFVLRIEGHRQALTVWTVDFEQFEQLVGFEEFEGEEGGEGEVSQLTVDPSQLIFNFDDSKLKKKVGTLYSMKIKEETLQFQKLKLCNE